MDDGNSNIYLSDSIESDDEFLRSVEITLMGIDIKSMPPATFVSGDWQQWLDRFFTPIIHPHFVAVYHASSATHYKEVVTLDQQLSKTLSGSAANSSVTAGEIFRDTKEDARHMPQWVRFEEKLKAEETPGHLATLFAIQSSLFNVPLFNALLSYGWVEWSAFFAKQNNRGDSPNEQGLFEKMALEDIKRALTKNDHEGPMLRSI